MELASSSAYIINCKLIRFIPKNSLHLIW